MGFNQLENEWNVFKVRPSLDNEMFKGLAQITKNLLHFCGYMGPMLIMIIRLYESRIKKLEKYFI